MDSRSGMLADHTGCPAPHMDCGSCSAEEPAHSGQVEVGKRFRADCMDQTCTGTTAGRRPQEPLGPRAALERMVQNCKDRWNAQSAPAADLDLRRMLATEDNTRFGVFPTLSVLLHSHPLPPLGGFMSGTTLPSATTVMPASTAVFVRTSMPWW